MERQCFICGLDRKDFEKEDKSFDLHINSEHSLWNYIYFMLYLEKLKPIDMTGIEIIVKEKIKKKSPEWIPRSFTRYLGIFNFELRI
jgi:hypothetical protein